MATENMISPEIEFIIEYAKTEANRELNQHFRFHEYTMREAPCGMCDRAKEILTFIEKLQNKDTATYQQQVANRIRNRN